MRRRILLAGAAGLGLAGCASPEPAYYTLAALPGPAVTGGPKLVELRRPGLAGYLDRPGIVRSGGNYRLDVAGQERWGEPLGDLIGRILAEDLNRRLPGTTVFTSLGALSAQPDAQVELDVQRFDADPSGEVVLLAQVAVTRNGNRGSAVTRTVRQAVRPASGATADVVAAMSRALAGLADVVAGMLRAPSRKVS